MIDLLTMFVRHKIDLDDKVLRYLLIGGGLLLGSIVKVGFDWLAEKFWTKTVSITKEELADYEALKKARAK